MTARKPDHLKVITGTARPDRALPPKPALPALEGVPPAPDWLPNAFAANEWRRLAPVLVANRLLHDGNVNVFGQLCALHGRLVQMWAAGTIPTAALLSAYRALSVAMGLTHMTLPAPAGKPNRFILNGKKR